MQCLPSAPGDAAHVLTAALCCALLLLQVLHQLRQLPLLPLHDGSTTSLAAPPRGLPVFFPPSVPAGSSTQGGGSSSTGAALQACGLSGPLQGVTYLAEELLQVGAPAAAAVAATSGGICSVAVVQCWLG